MICAVCGEQITEGSGLLMVLRGEAVDGVFRQTHEAAVGHEACPVEIVFTPDEDGSQ